MSTDPWTEKAACKDQPASIWFPEAGESHAPAKAVCAGCEVRAQCLQFALTTNEQYGIYGGLNRRERELVADGGAVRIKVCQRCGEQFTFWWSGGKNARTPNYCGESCLRKDRSEKRSQWRRGNGWKSSVEKAS